MTAKQNAKEANRPFSQVFLVCSIGGPVTLRVTLSIIQGRRIATMALQPWITDASVMSPPLGSDPPRAFGSEKARKIFEERMDAENSNFYGQVLAWSEDARCVTKDLE